MDNYLRRIRFEPDGSTLKVYGKKAITGALRINRNLFVRGLINGIDFAELKARAISLAPTSNELTFNKTLIVEGDVFMDNLWIDERNGTIDGVKLTNLLPIGTSGNNELILSDPRVSRRADAFGRTINVVGSLMDCQVTCSLQPMPNEAYVSYGPHQQSMPRSGQFYPGPPQYKPQPAQPVVVPAQSVMAYTSRPVTFNHQPLNYTLTRTTPPYGLPSTYQPPMMITTPRPMARPVNQAERVQQLVQRRPVSIKYEQKQMPSKRYFVPERVSVVSEQLEFLRNHIISINLVRLSSSSNLVVGFIEAPTNDVSAYSLSDQDMSHFDHVVSTQRSYLQLDQIDFPFRPTIYHLSVGVSTDPKGQNVTRVFSSLGGSSLHELSVLPIEFPNSALFINIPDVQVLFLLISQDYSINAGVCATSEVLSSSKHLDPMRPYHGVTTSRAESGVHVYLFHALQNSSSLTSAYFDLYQTIDLPGIDSFEKFTYNGSSYVLAVSRVLGRIYLLLLRGYTGFQVVSHIYEPMIDHVTIMYSLDSQPVLIIHQTSGLHRIMEAVVI